MGRVARHNYYQYEDPPNRQYHPKPETLHRHCGRLRVEGLEVRVLGDAVRGFRLYGLRSGVVGHGV